MTSDTPAPDTKAPPIVVPPDWYAVGPFLRYWDGSAWTQHTAPLPPAHMTAPAQQHSMPQQQMAPRAPVGPIMTFASHIAGKNAQVTIFADRVEWSKSGMMGGSKGSEMVPMRSISSVTTKKDGMVNTVVQVATSGGMIEMRCGHSLAANVRQCITDQLLRA